MALCAANSAIRVLGTRSMRGSSALFPPAAAGFGGLAGVGDALDGEERQSDVADAGEKPVEGGLVDDPAAQRCHPRVVGPQCHLVEPRHPALAEPPLDADLVPAGAVGVGLAAT